MRSASLSRCQARVSSLRAIADATQSQLQPLAEEAERRFSEPLLEAMANTPDRR